MSRYDGLIIPRSYSEYINKTDAATLLQALQLSGVMDNAPTANSNHPAKSSGVYTALAGKQATLTFDNVPTQNSNNPVKSSGIYTANQEYRCVTTVKVNSQNTKKIPFGNWGYCLCMGNIDGAGNFAFFLAKASTNIAINNLTLGNSFNQATLNNGVVNIGNATYGISLTFNSNGELEIAWTGSATSSAYYGRCAIICGNLSL